MLQQFEKNNGAISLFLTIILVPILVISFLFADASRIQLAKGVVSSAGDLTMNTVLTQYDATLNEYYGLMASSKDIDQFLSVANDYFQASLVSGGIDSSTAVKYADLLVDVVAGERDISDFLKIAGVSDFQVTPMENGNLKNPALVKKEIIEFMRYRAPIDAIDMILDRIKTNTSAISDSKKDTQLTEKQQDFYEDLGDLKEKALDLRKAIREYEENLPSKEKIEEMEQYLSSIKDQYKTMHVYMTKHLYNTQDITIRNEWGDIYELHSQTSNISATYAKDHINSYIHDTASNMQAFIEYGQRFDSDRSVFPSKVGNYGMQVWVHYDKALKENSVWTEFRRKAKSMINSRNNLRNAYKALSDDEEALAESYTLRAYTNVRTSGMKSRADHCDSLLEQYDQLFSNYFGSNAPYTQMWDDLSTLQYEWNGYRSTVDTDRQIKDIHAKLESYNSMFKDSFDALTKIAKCAKKLGKSAKKCRESYSKWNRAVDNRLSESESTIASMQKEDIDQLDEEIMSVVTEEAINELIDRVNNTKSLLGIITDGIKEYKYNHNRKSVIDIKDYDDFRSASGLNANSIVLNTYELENYANSSFEFTESNRIGQMGITEMNNPDLYNVNPPELYVWIRDNMNFDESKIEDGKKRYKDEQEKNLKNDDKDLKSDASANDLSTLGNNTPNLKTGDVMKTELKEINKNITSLFSDFPGTITSGAEDFRDDLYTLDYIFNMFSWDTYNKEGKYKLENHIIEGSDWGNTDLEFSENKTLTNKMINSANNWAFGNEVEYILYGNDNASNKKDVYTRIFLIRFVMDLIPMYQRYMGSNNYTRGDVLELHALAQSIQSTTAGTIPEMLVRVVFTIGFTVMEAAKDVDELLDGKPVLLLKSVDQLYTLFPGGTPYIRKEEDMKNGMFYSNYLEVFTFIKLVSASGEYPIYQRIANTIAANMDKIHEPGFSLDKANVYYSGNAEVRVETLFMKIPFVTNNGYDLSDGNWNMIKYKVRRGY